MIGDIAEARHHSERAMRIAERMGGPLPPMVSTICGTVALIGAGSIVYFALAWITGGMDREDLLVLLRRKKVEE